jgi:hypothetical protein
MSNPTTPFSWQMPTASDLVTDLPADFEVFGQAVATSMADLLGGTSGQVLAKNSNTDMDFVWVAQDDSNAIQNSIVDAKGDLISATANDTPARLAVGTDYAFLQADSTQSTGILWENAAWVAYTPTVTAQSGSFTTTSASGYYKRVGKICQVKAFVTITTVGTGTGPTFSLPFTAKASQLAAVGSVRETSITGNIGVCIVQQSASAATLNRYDNNLYAGNGFTFAISLTYEVA